jgi:hypothetical protein
VDFVKFSRCQIVTSPEHSIGSLLGAPLDVIEYGRGQFAALTYLTPTTAREVHILRLRSFFDRAGIAHKLRYALNVLNLMREVQELRNGYWFPTPLRAIPIEEQAILVGIVPTHELRRHFPSAARAGYARVCVGSDTKTLPKQEINAWLAVEAYDTVTWIEAKLRESRAEMGPTIPSGSIQYFNVETTRSAFGSVLKPVWQNEPRSALVSDNGVVFCRERIAREHFRYFAGQVRASRLVAEGSIPRDMIRFQFGFAAICGKPLSVIVTERDYAYIFHTPIGLPRGERQLILALGVRDMSFPGKVYRVRKEFVSLIEATLRRLGCDVRTDRV